jgi:hypothetical protein
LHQQVYEAVHVEVIDLAVAVDIGLSGVAIRELLIVGIVGWIFGCAGEDGDEGAHIEEAYFAIAVEVADGGMWIVVPFLGRSDPIAGANMGVIGFEIEAGGSDIPAIAYGSGVISFEEESGDDGIAVEARPVGGVALALQVEFHYFGVPVVFGGSLMEGGADEFYIWYGFDFPEVEALGVEQVAM